MAFYLFGSWTITALELAKGWSLDQFTTSGWSTFVLKGCMSLKGTGQFSLQTGAFARELGKRERKGEGGGGRESEPAGMTFNLESCIPFQYAEILAIPLVEKCEVGGQGIFVHNSFQITVHRDTNKAITDIKKRRGFLSRFWKNFETFPGRMSRSRNRKRQ